MIEYVVPENPDNRTLSRAASFLLEGHLIVFPTDTTWVLAADPESKRGVEQLFQLKGKDTIKHFSLLCASISQASVYATISDQAFRLIHRKLPGPYTFIFPPTKDVPKIVKNSKKEKQIGIRIPDSILCQRIIEFLAKPLLISSLSPYMITGSQDFWEMIYSYQIEDTLGHCIPLILDPGEFYLMGPSTIVDFSGPEGVPVILRKGAGSW